MTEEIYRANDPAQVKQRQQKAKRQTDADLDDLRELLKLPNFRRYLWRHMNVTCGLLRDPFTSNGSVQAYNIGMQAVARVMWAELERVDPAVIPVMMAEYSQTVSQKA